MWQQPDRTLQFAGAACAPTARGAPSLLIASSIAAAFHLTQCLDLQNPGWKVHGWFEAGLDDGPLALRCPSPSICRPRAPRELAPTGLRVAWARGVASPNTV